MLNLLKPDPYRLIHGKALWVMTVVLVACMAFAAGMLHWVTQPDFLAFYAQAEMMTVDEVQSELVPREEAEENFAVTVQGPGVRVRADGFREVPTADDFQDVSAEMRQFDSLTGLFGSGFVSGGFLAVTASLLVALFFSADFETRFIRNLTMTRRGRFAYYGEKLLLASLVSLWFLVVLASSCAASFALAGVSYRADEAVGGLLLWMLLVWLSATVYAWATALVVWITRSKAAGIAEAIVVSSAMFGALLAQALTYFGRILPWVDVLPAWLPSGALNMLAPGAAQLAVPGGALGFAGVPVGVSVVVVLLIWLAVCAALTFAVCRRRDL